MSTENDATKCEVSSGFTAVQRVETQVSRLQLAMTFAMHFASHRYGDKEQISAAELAAKSVEYADAILDKLSERNSKQQ